MYIMYIYIYTCITFIVYLYEWYFALLIYIYTCVHLCMHSAYGALVVDWWGYNASISITVLLNKSGIWCRLGLPEHPNPNPTSIDKPLLEKLGCQHSDTAQISIHSVCALIIQKIYLYVADDFGKPLAGQGACTRLIRGSPASVFSSRFLDNWHYIVMKSSLGKTMDRRKALFGPGEVIKKW